MNDHFQKHGRSLLANGYLIVPIRRGEKRPAIDGWQKSRLAAGDLARYPDHGVGVLCGQGAKPIVGVDIDVSHPVIGPALIAWCREHMGYGGERVGAAPRILLAYQAATAGWAKGNSITFFDPTDPLKPSGKENLQQVEILGLGQQFVAYHEHPDTHRDYEWTDLMGGLEYTNAGDLPIVSEAQISALLTEVSRLVRATPGVEIRGRGDSSLRVTGADDDLTGLTAKVGLSIREVHDLVGHLKNDGDDYDFWLHVGAALHHEYGDTEDADEALEIWREYGSRSSKDRQDQYGYKWRSFGKSLTGEPTTLRWLLKVCNQAKRAARVETVDGGLVDMTDSGNVNALADITEGDMRFVHGVNLWMHWDGLTWKIDATGGHAKQAVLRVAEMYRDRARQKQKEAESATSVEDRKRLQKLADSLKSWANYCRSRRGIDAVLSLAARDHRFVVQPDALDRDRFLLGVANGAVDLRTGKLRAASRDDLITKRSPYAHHECAQAPRFRTFIQEVCSEPIEDERNDGLIQYRQRPEQVAYLHKALGYAMTGNIAEQKMFIASGPGANGKSVLLDLVEDILGPYAVRMPPEALMASARDGDAERPTPFARSVAGARLVVTSEAKEGQKLNVALVKRQTGDAKLTARGMRENAFTFDVTHKLWLLTNHHPELDQSDEAIRSRLHIVPFDRVWNRPGSPIRNNRLADGDKNLIDELRKEAEGILAWLVEGACKYITEGLEPPPAVLATTADYLRAQDPLGRWLDGMKICDAKAGNSASALLEDFMFVSRRDGVERPTPNNATAFGKALNARNIPRVRTSAGVVYGLTHPERDPF